MKKSMKRTIPTILILSFCALMSASCEKGLLAGFGNPSSIKLTVSGVMGTKASAITSESIKTEGFNISAYVTDTWNRDVIGNSPDIQSGIFIDPGPYEGPYDENTYPDEYYKLKDIPVYYASGAWWIEGNEDPTAPRFSWVNGVAMNFFSYAPKVAAGRTINKNDSSTDDKYPFSYTTPVTDGVVGPSDCADLIFAFTQHTAAFESDQTNPNYGELKSGYTDKIDIMFHHAMAQIRFCLSTNDGTFNPSYELVSVRLENIKRQGECTFIGSSQTFEWPDADLAKPTDYLQTFNASFLGGTAPSGWTSGTYNKGAFNLFTNTADVLFVIPQSLSECRVRVTLRQGESTTTLTGKLPATTDLSPDVSWGAGKYYTYKISTSGESDKIALCITLADWAERENYIPID